MSQDKTTQDTGEQVTEEVKVDAVVAPTEVETTEAPKKEAEEIVEEDLSEYGVPPMPEPEEEGKEEAKSESGEEGTTVVTEAKPEVAPVVEPIIQPREASSIDKRIAKLYQETQVLQGKEAPEMEAIVESIRTGSFQEKRDALNRLLHERKLLRGGQNDGVVEMSPEDREALIQAEADERFNAMQGEIQQREFDADLVKTLDDHPELKIDSKEFNPAITQAVEQLVLKGIKTSEAYALVTNSLSVAKGDAAKQAAESEEIKKQKALSGAVSASNDFAGKGKEMSWTEFDKLRTADPDRYEKLSEKIAEGTWSPSDEE